MYINSYKHHNLVIGRYGEEVAKRYLTKRGYKIIEQNYRTKYAEIDLITRYRKNLVFFEVKAKLGEKLGTPEDSLNKKKIKRVARACLFYLSYRGCFDDYRIDAICIVFDQYKNLERINHYSDINF